MKLLKIYWFIVNAPIFFKVTINDSEENMLLSSCQFICIQVGGWGYIISIDFRHFPIFNQKWRQHPFSPMILSQFHQLFSIDHSLGPILTHWVTKYKYELPVMWHQLLKNIVSEDWLDSKEPSRSQIMK